MARHAAVARCFGLLWVHHEIPTMTARRYSTARGYSISCIVIRTADVRSRLRCRECGESKDLLIKAALQSRRPARG